MRPSYAPLAMMRWAAPTLGPPLMAVGRKSLFFVETISGLGGFLAEEQLGRLQRSRPFGCRKVERT
jgi:hypothetical protein